MFEILEMRRIHSIHGPRPTDIYMFIFIYLAVVSLRATKFEIRTYTNERYMKTKEFIKDLVEIGRPGVHSIQKYFYHLKKMT